jgi:PAS domain S-box-containing protein
MGAEQRGVGRAGRPAEHLGLGFDQATIGMALVDLDGRFLRVNHALCRLLGRGEQELLSRTAAELLGATPQELVGAPDPAAGGAGRTAARAAGRGSTFHLERRCQRRDGAELEVGVDVTVLRDPDGEPVGFLGQVQDLTERKQAARALRVSELWLRSVVAEAPIVLSVYDRDGVCTFSEGRAFEKLGISPAERVGRTYVALRGDEREGAAELKRLLAGEGFSAKRPVGERVFDVHYRPLHDPDHGISGVVSVAVDVTDLERVERDRRNLLRQLITAQEEERRRLAGDLHDDAIQSLTAARMHLSVLDHQLDRLEPAAADAVRRHLVQVRENLDQGLRAARTFLFDLRPPLLDTAGLEAALRQQLDKLAERTGWATEVAWELGDRLDRDLEAVAFRVAQEALANAARHARAATVRVRASRELGGTLLALEIADDGEGFDPGAARQRALQTGHLGLRSMAERIETAGGRLTIDAAPGRGTRVVLRLPVSLRDGQPAGRY